MFKNIRLYAVLALLMATVAALAQETKSFSRRMNEIKRSGDYVYAEASAPNEADAKAASDALLKIEITKYLASESQDDMRIVKDISAYNREYLVQPRGDMVRVFGYVAKSSVAKAKKEDKKDKDKKKDEAQPQPEKTAEPETPATSDKQPADEPVTEQPAAENTVAGLQTGSLQLARWQIDMLENIIKEPNMAEAKKVLNRYKFQNRIKRLGDRSASNPRPADSFFLVFGDGSAPAALLAPSATDEHFDMISGATVNIGNYSSNQYLWFQISK